MEDGQALGGRGWYRHPLLSLLILSDHLPSTIALATSILRRDPARQLSADQSLAISLFLVLAYSIPEIRISTVYRDPLSLSLSLLLSLRFLHHLIRDENFITGIEGGTFPASNRSICRLFKIFLPFRTSR